MRRKIHPTCRRAVATAQNIIANTGLHRSVFAALSLSIVSTYGQTSVFTSSASSNWSAPTNWSPAPPAALGNLTIADSTPLNSLLLDDGSHVIGSLTFGNTGLRTAAFTVDATLPGSSFTISGGLTAAGDLPGSATTLTLRGGITVNGDQTWNVGGIVSGADKDNGIAITGPVSGAVAGVLTVNGTLTKTGPGLLTLTGVTLGNGSLAISSGALRLHASLGKTLTVGGAGTNGQVTIADGAQLLVYQDTTGDFGTIADPSITKPFVLNGVSNVELAGAGATDVAIGSPIAFNGTHGIRIFSGNSASSVTYRLSGDISGSGTISLTSGGSGPRLLVLSGNNSAFAGNIVVGGRNVLRLASSTAGSAQATYELTGGNTAIESSGSAELVIGGLSGTLGTVRNGGATNTVLRVGGADQDTTLAGAITNGGGGGTLSMIKEGAGDLILSGVGNNYSGPTSVNEGGLVVSGAITASPVTVNAGGTLGGSGSVTAITLGAGGSISPGNTDGHIESLAATSVTWNGGGSPGMKFDLSSVSSVSDQLLISGAFAKGAGSGFTFDFLGGGFEGGSYTLLTFGSLTGFSASDFQFTNLGAGLTGTFAVQPNAVTFTVIPEPSSMTACLVGVMLCGIRRRR
jgi:autotransporter-associated beta strand protein